MRRWRLSDGATWTSSAGLPRSTSYWVTNPLALSARSTLWPNSTGARTLPRLIRSVCGSKMEYIFSDVGTCSPSSTRRRAWPITRAPMFGEWLARGALACELRHRRGLRHRLLGGDLVLGGCALQLLELQLDLIEKPRRPLRPGAIELAG